ncbi:glutathione S-transferase [Thalassotalea sp. G2M2-11]|uniref:glutathione S-transferase n=1 Tax=Thalassotalea sp. G2M2-11 TaxID=2787627 RepID=UPI0019D2BC99|nr:glutathione S-transferase [Thalassotalea sp. G2M2-11]
MLTVHHLNNSRSQRILWALEELGVNYEVQRYEREPGSNLAPTSLKAIHPLGKSPVITDQDKTIAESGAIIEYLVSQYPAAGLKPELGTEAHQQYLYWLHFAEGSLMPQLLLKLAFEKVSKKPMPFFVRSIAKGLTKKVMDGYVGPNIESNMKFIEEHLKAHEWFAGDQLSGADIQMSFPLEACVAKGLDSTMYPHIYAYVKKIHARSAYKRALEVGGSYDYA